MLTQALKRNGIKIWIDKENLTASDNIVNVISKAVENSSIVLICYSDAYSKSSCNRLEAEYAVQSRKKVIAVRMEANYRAHGWLGILLNSQEGIDLSNSTFEDNDDNIRLLLERIQNNQQ